MATIENAISSKFQTIISFLLIFCLRQKPHLLRV